MATPAAPSESRVLGDPIVTTAETFFANEYIDVVFEPSPLLGGAFRLGKMPGTPMSSSKFPWGNKGNYLSQDGREAWIPVAYGDSSNTTDFSGGATLNLNADDVGTTLRSDYANYTDAAAIYRTEANANSGSAKRLDLYKERGKQALRGLSSTIEGHLWGANADTAEGTQNQVVGVQTLISTGDTNTAWKLSRSTYSFHRNNNTTVSTDFASTGLTSMRNMWRSCSGNGGFDKPTCIGTTSVLYGAYEQEAEGIHEITSTKSADLGMESILYKGVPVFYSDNCLSGAMYFFNLNYLYVCVPSGQEFETVHYGENVFPQQAVKEAIRFFVRLNWGFSRDDRQGVIDGFTDT